MGVAFVSIRTIASAFKRDTLTSIGGRSVQAIMDGARFAEFDRQAPALHQTVNGRAAARNRASTERRRVTLIYP